MKKTFLILALAALPLSAQNWELGLFIGQQAYPSPHSELAPGVTAQATPDSKTVFGARLGYSVVDMGPCLFQLTGGFQPESKSTTKLTLGGTPAGETELKQSHWSVGAMFNFKAVVAIGAGLEYRSEKISSDSDSTTYGRPWIRANIGYAVPTPVVKPFFGLEVAFPLTTKSSTVDPNASAEDGLKAFAPKSQIGLYAGIRF